MFGALVGLKTEEEPNEDDGPWLLEDTITLPSQYKYRKKRLPDWRKAHDFTQPRLVKSTSMLGAIKDDVGAFLFGPAQLSAAAKAWERRKRKKLQKEKLHKERMEFAALTLPRFAERMAEMRDARLLAWAKVLAQELFKAWRVRAHQRACVRRMMGKNIDERLTEMIQSWRQTTCTIIAYKRIRNRSRRLNLLDRFKPWQRFTVLMRKKRRYAYAVFRSSVVWERNQLIMGNIMKVWFKFSHKKAVVKRTVRRMQMRRAWPAFNSWHILAVRSRRVKQMLRRHFLQLKETTFLRFKQYMVKVKKERRRKLKQFAARMKSSRLLPGWNIWYALHSKHKVAKFVQARYRGIRSRRSTASYRKALVHQEVLRRSIEQEEMDRRMKSVHLQIRKERRRCKGYYNATKGEVKSNHREAMSTVRSRGKEKNVESVYHAIFSSFCMDPRYVDPDFDQAFEVVPLSSLPFVLKECGIKKMSKVRYEVFVNRCNFISQDAISFKEFIAGLKSFDLLPKKMGFGLRGQLKWRGFTGQMYRNAARVKVDHKIFSALKRRYLRDIRGSGNSPTMPKFQCPHCLNGYLLYTELFDHLGSAPNGCPALIEGDAQNDE